MMPVSLVLKAVVTMTVAVVALVPVPVGSMSGDVIAGPVDAEVLRVLDGDTLEVKAKIWLSQEIRTEVRLLGVDTPERRGRCGEERTQAAAARAVVYGAVAEGSVRLYDVSFGKYAGRVSARVETLDGRALAALLLERGLALPYQGGRRPDWCVGAGDGKSE